MERSILHIDMNCFYASVECMQHPELKGLPVAVGGDAEERRGIILTKNYKAKAFGIKTGEAIWQAKQKCPDLLVILPHYDQYMKFSKLAREIYGRYTDLIEPYGMDEVWADVTGSIGRLGSAEQIAEEIRQTIKRELGLTVSIGVSFNKIFAKLGSDMKKPDAVTVIPKESFREKIWDLPASAMLGVGHATEKKLRSFGIDTIGELARWPVEFYQKKFGKWGIDLWRFANGMDHSPVIVRDFEAVDKSVGHGTTALQDLENNGEVWNFILELSQDIGHRLYQFNKKANGIALAVRDNELCTKQWQCGIPLATQSPSYIAQAAYQLFTRSYDWHRPIRSLTVRAISLTSRDTPTQLDLFCDAAMLAKSESLDKTVEMLRGRFGNDIIRNACLLTEKKLPQHRAPDLIMPSGVAM